MLTIYTESGVIPLKCNDYYVKELASGLDELVFSMNIWDPDYRYMQEETSVREESGAPCNYLIKAIDGGVNTAQIKAQIDLDEWKANMVIGYSSGSHTLVEIVTAVAPEGWTVTDTTGFSYNRTINLDAATPFDVLDECRKTFSGCTFRFDNIGKSVVIINELGGQNLGAFATRELNLSGCEYKGKSTGVATRLYAYGKDNLSFANINNGKPYVENHTYSQRVICAYWKDERYTVAANLMSDAQAKLDQMAVPQRSFDCDVVDLAAVDPDRFGHLEFPLFSIIGLIDETRSSVKINHRVVGRWRYPNQPEKNKILLSTIAPRIQSQVFQVTASLSNANSEWNRKQQAAISQATSGMVSAAEFNALVDLSQRIEDSIPILITRQPQNWTAHSGDIIAVTVQAEGSSLSYQWYRKGAAENSYTAVGTNSSGYGFTVTESGSVYCVITDELGNKVATRAAIITMEA